MRWMVWSSVTMGSQTSHANQKPNFMSWSIVFVHNCFHPLIWYLLQALMQADVRDSSRCYFIDDSLANVQAAKKLGWGSCVYFCEKDALGSAELSPSTTDGVDHVISDLGELRRVWPEIFRSTPTVSSASRCASPP
jgi:phosphoglycolate phosphatase-like HAD superfamily hydrolase